MLIQKYNPAWEINFHLLQEVINTTLKGHVLRIEHIGSTSVPGLSAKPIIDIDIVYDAELDLGEIKKRLMEIGYRHNGDQGIPHREAFKSINHFEKHPILDAINHHLYACPKESEELQRHLLFRDFLRKNVWARMEYQLLKYEIAKEAKQDRKVYAKIKEGKAREFINSIVHRARLE